VITQLFFDNADFFEFRDHVAGKLGVKVPIIPGVIAILSAAQITRFTQLCGSKIPLRSKAKLDQVANDDDAAMKFGIEYATQQCEALLRAGRAGIAFLHAQQGALHGAGLEKSRAGVGRVFKIENLRFRSAPVPGRSNVHLPGRGKFTEALFSLGIAAAGDGRTPYFKKTL